MADVKVRMLLEDQVSSKLKQIDSSLEGFKNGLASGFKQLSSMVTPMQMLSLAAGALGVAMTAAKKAFDLGREGAQLERLQDAGTALAKSFGSNMDEIVTKVKEASLDTVSTMDVIASANKAMMLGVTADADKMSKLMEVAALRGRAMGLSTTQAFDDIVRGIGRLSPLILDNLGIVIDADRTYKEYAETLGKTTEKLTAAEKRQALLNRVLQEGQTQLDAVGGLQEDAATGFEQLDAAVKDLSDAFKMDLAPAATVAAKALGDYADYINTQREAQEAATKALELGLITEGQHRDIIANINRGTLDAAFALDEMRKKLDDFDNSLKGVNPDMAELIRLSEESTNQVLDLAGALPKLDDNLDNVEKATLKFAGAQKLLSEEEQNVYKHTLETTAAVEEFAGAMRRAGSEADGLTSKVDALKNQKFIADFSFRIPNIADQLAEYFKGEKWKAAGGEALMAFVEDIPKLFSEGKIGEGIAEEMKKTAFVAATQIEVALGNIDASTAAQNIADTLGVSLEDAKALLQDIIDMASFNAQAWVTINYKTGKGIPGGKDMPIPDWDYVNDPDGEAIGGFTRGGPTWVGEAGPELLWLPGNAQVMSNTQIASAAMSGGGPTIGNVNVYAAQGQSPTQIANAVIAQINRAMKLSRSSGIAYVG